jgi:hypothetical protein
VRARHWEAPAALTRGPGGGALCRRKLREAAAARFENWAHLKAPGVVAHAAVKFKKMNNARRAPVRTGSAAKAAPGGVAGQVGLGFKI